MSCGKKLCCGQVCTIVGGLDSNAQSLEISRKPHLVVATPGRLAVCTHAAWAGYANWSSFWICFPLGPVPVQGSTKLRSIFISRVASL